MGQVPFDRPRAKEEIVKTRHVIIAPLVAALLASAAADGQMMGPGPGMGGSMGFFSNSLARSPYFGSVDMRAIAASWLAALHTALAITPEQESAWLAFANAVTDQAADMQAFRTQIVQPTTATAPERAALAAQFMAQRLESTSALSASMSALYAQLTPAQRVLLDQGYAAVCWPGGLFGS
jgi:hypothetical protein